ncbi:MAG: DUF4861 domain-containing protein [Gemmatimonadota bacterium]|nr:MAG: DUF4861 domain-containing protein [Gemmatimonadota bacterium]
MNNNRFVGFLLRLSIVVIAFTTSCQKESKETTELKREFPKSFPISIQNTINLERRDSPVSMDVGAIINTYPDFNAEAFVVHCDGTEMASQAIDLNGTGQKNYIIFMSDFLPHEKKELVLHYAATGKRRREYSKRTQAEISHKVGGRFVDKEYEGGEFRNVQFVRVPPEHTDHSTYFRYEGPGWESDRVGYRFYLDWRNAIDIFGKKTSDMVLHTVGLDGFDSYHEMADWGMDIFKVGESLGIGSVGMWQDGKVHMVSETDSITCQIIANGPVHSQIETEYYGWNVGSDRYDLNSNLSISAGSRLTKHIIQISENPKNVCTGLAKHTQCDVLYSENKDDEGWGYFGLYGLQSLANDKLGTAILFRKEDFLDLREDSLSHVLLLRPRNGCVTYYFLAAWAQEPDGIRTKEEFHRYLKETVMQLNNPIAVSY